VLSKKRTRNSSCPPPGPTSIPSRNSILHHFSRSISSSQSIISHLPDNPPPPSTTALSPSLPPTSLSANSRPAAHTPARAGIG
jgi:hypothetical protein